MTTASVKSIVESYLDSNGYGGLYTDGCGCKMGDLAPCLRDGIPMECKPGYLHTHTKIIGDWIIASDKEPKTDEEIEAIIKQADL
jgi:hypothetical protein